MKNELLVIKIVDFTERKEEPGFDVVVYRKGRLVLNETKSFRIKDYKSNIAMWNGVINHAQIVLTS